MIKNLILQKVQDLKKKKLKNKQKKLKKDMFLMQSRHNTLKKRVFITNLTFGLFLKKWLLNKVKNCPLVEKTKMKVGAKTKL